MKSKLVVLLAFVLIFGSLMVVMLKRHFYLTRTSMLLVKPLQYLSAMQTVMSLYGLQYNLKAKITRNTLLMRRHGSMQTPILRNRALQRLLKEL